MNDNSQSTNGAILAQKMTIPEHVVYRAFVKETVVLNLQSGKYHGLNPTGGRMLEAMEHAPTVAAAAERLAGEYGVPRQEIEGDLCDFCRELAERCLIVLADPEPA